MPGGGGGWLRAPVGAAGGSGAGRGQRGRPGAAPRARLCHGRMEFGAVGRMRGLSRGRCRVCLGPGIIYPVPSLVPIPTVFAMNSSILAGAGLTSSTQPSGRLRPGEPRRLVLPHPHIQRR